MKRQVVLIEILLILLCLLFLSGCFKVERNNPYDPFSNNPNLPEGKYKLTGFTLRGNSPIPLTNVEIKIDGQIVNSDSTGEYSVYISKGSHQLSAYKYGWEPKVITVDTEALAGASDLVLDIEMYIFTDDFESYANITDFYNSHWTTVHNADSWNFELLTINDNQGVKETATDATEGLIQMEVSQPYPTEGNVKPVGCYLELVFGSNIYNYIQSVFLEDPDYAAPFFMIQNKNGYLYYSSGCQSDVEMVAMTTSTWQDKIMCFTFYIDPGNAKQGHLEVTVPTGETIYGPSVFPLTTDTDIDEIYHLKIMTSNQYVEPYQGEVTCLDLRLF